MLPSEQVSPIKSKPFESLILQSDSMRPILYHGLRVFVFRSTTTTGDVIAFKSGDIIIVHRLIARLPWPLDRWGLQRGDAHQLGSWIDLRRVVGKVVWPEVSEPTTWVAQAAEIGCHLVWGAASRTKRCVMKLLPGKEWHRAQQSDRSPGRPSPAESKAIQQSDRSPGRPSPEKA